MKETMDMAFAAMSKAGFEVEGFMKKSKKKQTFWLLLSGARLKQPEYNGAAHDVLVELRQRTAGEVCNLERALKAQDWRHAFSLVQELIRAGNSSILNVGDFIRVKFDVPAAEHDGVEFPAMRVESKVEIIETESDEFLFSFAEIILRSAFNAKDTNEGGFSKTALGKYLNNEFLKAFGISDVLVDNNDGLKISLPTAFELFGESEYWADESNFSLAPSQIEYFKNEKNRVKTFEDETCWYWTSSARASSAARFCDCSNYGHGIDSTASSVGGVAPVFCVA